LVQTRLGALYHARQDMDYLESSLRSLLPFVETVLVGVRAGQLIAPGTLPESSKIHCIEGGWKDRIECDSALIRELAAQGITYAFLMEPEDVLAEQDLVRILNFLRAHPEAGQFLSACQHYWKSPTCRIEPPDLQQKVLISRIDQRTRFVAEGETNQAPVISIPEHVGQIHCFAFASPTQVVRARLKAHGLPSHLHERWEREVWQCWNRGQRLRSLHPFTPERFRTAVRVNAASLPDALSGHPYLPLEIAGEATINKPLFSAVFQASSGNQEVEALLQNLARTAPACFEWVACVSGERQEMIEWLRQKPGGRVVPIDHSASLWSRWSEAAEAARGRILVFLHDRLSFEGDWLEGLEAAIDRNSGAAVFFPRVYAEALSEPVESCTASSLSPKQILFERRRGEFFGTQTPVNSVFLLEEQACFACSRETWKKLVQLQNGGQRSKGSGRIRNVIVEDTLVFADGGMQNWKYGISESHIQATLWADASGQSNVSSPHISLVGRDAPLAASIVIPVFNNLPFTRQCLDSIFQNTTPGTYELIVVDNGSTDGSREFLESQQPRIRYIRNQRNLLFARGCNRGAWAARGENVLFLNNDTVVGPGWLDAMLEVLDQAPEIGIVGNKQLFPESNPAYPGLVWHAGMVFTEEKDSWHAYFGFDPAHPIVNVQRDYPCVTGCCLLIRKTVFERLGGFDPWFQNGYEDTDLCLRAGRLEVRIVYTPKSEIVHYVSASESRFDRHAANFLRFRDRWADRIIPSEAQTYSESGIWNVKSGVTGHQTSDCTLSCRVGFLSVFNQPSPFADYAAQLLAEYPAESRVVLGNFAARDQLLGPDPHYLFRCWDTAGTWLQPLLRCVSGLQLEIVHVNLDLKLLQPSFLSAFKGLKSSGKRLVMTFHETSPPSALLREFCDLADAVIVHAPANRLELILNGCEACKIQVVEPGASTGTPLMRDDKEGGARPAAVDAGLRQKLGLPQLSKIIATPGFVSRRKGILRVIDALSSIRQAVDVYYLILGTADLADPDSANYLGECKTAVRQRKLEDRVTFKEEHLPYDELKEHLLCADAVVLSYQTQQHGWSSAAALALALERPTVTSSDPMFSNLGDAVLRATAGISLAQAIASVLTNPFLAEQLRDRARDYARAHSWNAVAARHWDIYRTILERPVLTAPSPFVRYQKWNARALPSLEGATLFAAIQPHLWGRVIELGSRNLELTEALRPIVSVTSQAELVTLAQDLRMATPFVALDQFRQSSYASDVFDTILLHLHESAEGCIPLVLGLVSHLAPEQKIVLSVSTSSPHLVQTAKKFEVALGTRGLVTQLEAGLGLRVTILRKETQAIDAGVENINLASDTKPRIPGGGAQTLNSKVHVCWEGPQLINHSLALVNREMEMALIESGRAGLSILPVGADTFASGLNARDRRLKQYYGCDSRANVHVHVRHQWPPNWEPPDEGHFVVIQPWEYGSVPVEWVQKINTLADEVWCPSAFVRELYVQSGVEASRAHVVPNGVDTELFKPGLAPFHLRTAKPFRFLFVGGTIPRKGADLLLKAYQQSFTAKDDVALVIKDMGTGNLYQGQGLGDQIRQIQKAPGTPEIIYLDADLTASELAALYSACDCLVHPYRGEGFALPVLEAMACGLPIVVTGGGATDDFVDETVGYRLGSTRRVFGNREISGLRCAGDLWMLEPDCSQLAETLSHVYRNPQEARRKGTQGRVRAEAAWTWKHAAQRALERMEAMRQRPILRCLQKVDCAILLDFRTSVSPAEIQATLESLDQNSYSSLKVFLRGNARPDAGLAQHFPGLQELAEGSFSKNIEHIRSQVRARFLVVISEPLRFSKQWLGQITSLAQTLKRGPVVLAPSIDIEGVEHHVHYDGSDEEYAFQKFSRAMWRSRRGQFQEMAGPPAGCAVMSWECLESRKAESTEAWQEWIRTLQDEGVHIYWAQDTFVGVLRGFAQSDSPPLPAECAVQ